MESNLQQFQNEEFGKIRAFEIDGQPWFVGKDVAGALGYSRPDHAINKHVDPEDKLMYQIGTSGQMRNMLTINESGLYSLILSSKLPKARQFKRWVTSDVLPSIRKYGAYATEETLRRALGDAKFERNLLESMLDEVVQKNRDLSDSVTVLAPKARYCDTILSCKNVVPVSVIAKDYGMSAAAFNQLLHGLGIQYKIGGTWLLYQGHAGQGYTRTRTYHVNDYTAAVHTYWTQKGRLFLYKKLKQCGVLPLMEV